MACVISMNVRSMGTGGLGGGGGVKQRCQHSCPFAACIFPGPFTPVNISRLSSGMLCGLGHLDMRMWAKFSSAQLGSARLENRAERGLHSAACCLQSGTQNCGLEVQQDR